MANRAIWNIRRRHEWLAKPAKSNKLSRRGRVRVGLQAALDRKTEDAPKDAKLSALDPLLSGSSCFWALHRDPTSGLKSRR